MSVVFEKFDPDVNVVLGASPINGVLPVQVVLHAVFEVSHRVEIVDGYRLGSPSEDSRIGVTPSIELAFPFASPYIGLGKTFLGMQSRVEISLMEFLFFRLTLWFVPFLICLVKFAHAVFILKMSDMQKLIWINK